MLRGHQRTASTHGATPSADPDISPASKPSRRQCYSPVAGRSMRTQRETTLQWGRRALLFQGRPHKASGRCCGPGCARTGASRRTSCRFTSASSSSCTMRADAAKPCSAPSSPPFLDDSGQHPGTQQEPLGIAGGKVLASACFQTI